MADDRKVRAPNESGEQPTGEKPRVEQPPAEKRLAEQRPIDQQAAERLPAVEPAPAQPVPEDELEVLNLSEVTPRRRHMYEEELTLDWDSYTAKSTALCAKLTSDVSVESGEGEQPTSFNVRGIKGHPKDVVLIASKVADESTIGAHWPSESKVHLYLEKLLHLRPLNIPRGMRAHIEVSRYPLSKGAGLRLHFGEVRFAEIPTTRGQRTSSPGDETAAGQDPDSGQDE